MASNSKIEVMRVRAELRKTFLPQAQRALGEVGSGTSFDRSKFVRALYEGEHTYKSIARHCHDAWKGEWSPPDHPIIGLYLVEAAQERMHVRFDV